MFESARAKIGRAEKHLDQLKGEFRGFVRDHMEAVSKELDPNTRETVVFYNPLPMPEPWPLVIGEFLFNLRCALDYAVYELGAVPKQAEFPILKSSDLWEKRYRTGKDAGKLKPGCGLYKIDGITHQGARDFIKGVQPYHAGEKSGTFDYTPLWMLHELNNIDKHRTLHLCRRSPVRAARIGVEGFDKGTTFAEVKLKIPRNLEKRAELARLRGGDADMKVNQRITMTIEFEEVRVAGAAGRSIERVADMLFDRVVEIVNELESIVSA